MAGRPPKPSALKLVEGNRGKRAINANEPEPALLNDLDAPAHLSPAAADVWRELAPKLRSVKVLTELDTPLLEMTCNALALYRTTSAKTAAGSLVVNNGISPWAMLQSMSFKQAMAALREWGATPAARSRVTIDPQGQLFPPAPAAGAGGTSRFFK